MIRLLLLTLGVSVLGLAPLCAAAPEAPPDPHAHVQEILQRPLYQRWQLRQERAQWRVDEALSEQPWVQRLGDAIERFFNWLGEMFRKLFPQGPSSAPSNAWWDGLGSLTGALKVAAWVALAVAVVLIAIFLYRALRGNELRGRGARILSREQVRAALEQGQALALDSPQWLEEAERLARERDPRAVYRALYLALLSGLHATGKIDFRKNRTNWNYVQRFRGPDEHRGMFGQLTEMFDQVWYGLRAADIRGIEQVRHTVAVLVSPRAAGASPDFGRPTSVGRSSAVVPEGPRE